jgi:hypothetical protein
VGSAVVTFFGVDTGIRTLGEADHLIHGLAERLGLPVEAVACTHLIRSGGAHVAVSLWVPPVFGGVWNELTRFAESAGAGVASETGRSGHPELSAAAADAVGEHVSRGAGRAVLYPGSATLTGTMPVGHVLAASAIARLVVVGGTGQPVETDLVDTRGHVRPEWRDGELVLAVTPGPGGQYAPFEVPNPTPCCADHGS